MGVSAVVIVVLAWGALAFGAVYPWAYLPLMVGCAAIGLYGLFGPVRTDGGPSERWLKWAYLLLVTGCLLQLVPVPQAILAELSPATDRLLREFDLSYVATSSASARGGLLQVAPQWHPLSINPSRTVLGLSFLIAFGLFLGGLHRLFDQIGVRRVVVGLVCLGGLLALLGIVQKAQLGDDAYGGMRIYGFWKPENRLATPFGPFVNKNHFAGWMVMTLPLTLAYFTTLLERATRRSKTGWRDWVVWSSTPDGGALLLVGFAVIVMGLSLMMTNSRSGIGAFAAAVGVMSIVALRSLPSRKARLIGAGSLLAVFLASLAWAGSEVALRRVSDVPEAVELRLDAWRDGVGIVRDFPITGTGLNTYGTATLFYSSSVSDRWFREAHNDYLQILAEGGLLLGLPALLLVGAFVMVIRGRFREDRSQHHRSWLRIGAVVGLGAIGLQSLVEFSLQMPGNAVLFVVLAAIAIWRAPRHQA